MSAIPEAPQGWTNFGGQSKKWHYIAADQRSLCGKWMIWERHELDERDYHGPDNCAECWRRRAKQLVVKP